MALLNILRELSELGGNTILVAIRSKNISHIKQPQIRILSIPLRSLPLISPVLFTLVLVFFLPFYVIVSKPDFVIFDPGVHILGALPALLVAKFRKVKFVLDIRTTPVELVGFHGFLHRFWFSLSVLLAKKSFNGITIITSSMKKEVCNDFDLNPDKVGVWTSGVSDTLFNPENLKFKKEDLRRKLALTGKFVIFYHGVFTATRALTETIEAIRILIPKYSNVVFFLLGTGPMVGELRTEIQAKSLQENVIIHDPVDQSEVPNFISICDVCIVPLPNHPYWRYQSPLKLLEYLAMRKVVILTDIPAHRSVVGKETCGIYISSVNPSEIAKAMEYAYNNKENLEDWGKIGRKIIKEKYTWPRVAKDLEKYLLSIE